MNPRIVNQPYQQRTNYVKKTITYAPPVILPTKYITETPNNYPYPTGQYSTSTQPKPVTNPQYQAYTAPTYSNYPQNNNVNYTFKYSGETERQTYQNNQNGKLAQNYGIIDQKTLQKIHMHKRPSAGMVQNYKNINSNNINMNQIPKNNIQYNERKVNYVQPQQKNNNINNVNNYYQNNNINNNIYNNIYNNYNYTDKNNRKYNYEYNDNSMYIVQIATTKTNQPQRANHQQNIPQNNNQPLIVNQHYHHNQNIKQNVKNNNVNNNIYNEVNKYFYTNPPQQQQQIYTNQTKNIIPNPNIPTHHQNNSAYNPNNILIKNQVNPNLNNTKQINNQTKANINNMNQINNQVKTNMNNINQINNHANANINNINNIPKQNKIIQQNQHNQQTQLYNQILNSTGYPQQKVVQPQLQKNIPKPVVKGSRHSNMEEPPDNMRNRGKHPNPPQNNEYFNNTMPNLKTYNDILPGPNNIITNETTNSNNYYGQSNFNMTFDNRNKIAKINMYNVPQKINELSFTNTSKNKPIQTNQNIINKNAVNNITNNANYQKQNNGQIQKNNNIIHNDILSENVEYRDQYGNILVYINGQFIDKRLLVNNGSNHNKVINNNNNINKQINNQNINSKDINIAQNNNDIKLENKQFTNTYPLPGQKTYSTQTLINNNLDQNTNVNMNINNNIYQNPNQNYSQRSNRFLEDQNFTNTNINNYNINLNVNQQNDLINDINNLFKNQNNAQVNQPEILTVEPQKPKRRRPVFKIPPSKKRSISQGRSLAFIHKYYDENFILEEENEDNASDSENKKLKKSIKNAVKEVINIKKLVPNQQNDEEDKNKKQNDEINNNKEEMPSNEINKENKDIENNDNENNNNVMRLSHMGFSLERSSILPENELNKNDNDNLNKENNIDNDKYNLDDLNIDKNIYEEKNIDPNENSKKMRRNIDINMDEDNDDNLNIDKINEKLNEKLKLYTEKEKEKQNLENSKENLIHNQKLSGEISKPNIYNISEEEKNYKNSKSDEIQKGQIPSTNNEQNSKLDNPYINNENIMANNSSISQNLLRDSDISFINPKFYEPMKDSIRNLQINDFDNNENNKEDERINMNIEGHDLDKYFKNENEKKEIKKKEVDSSLRTINSEWENRNSQQIVDNLEEEEEKNNNNIVNNNIQQKKSGESNIRNEKLKTVNDIITGNNIASENSKNIINNNKK